MTAFDNLPAVSIHAPREGSDDKRGQQADGQRSFNPRSP